MSFEVPEHIRPLRARVRQFIEERIYPVETQLDERGDAARVLLRRLMDEAKAAGLWALGHPKEIGGQGLPFLDYVYVNTWSLWNDLRLMARTVPAVFGANGRF